ncbi:glycerol-3-phosphate dehydrogenase (FAD-dependent), mitochondrial [Leishmania infantum JPCM5]|uniref:Glycerol-3-phosphate dehydrogenase n=3 Tax=Leishmania donovani species complex TaxID=38574 RepID=A0A6L0XTR2_LEIIN|nr:glycerol-3-phosphate dehydrogenase (FAD-dependent), mitochondrial [Leishmania infantum JPCM5]XP_003862125.1 glycerol-3-phosphate dehydrogenase (FAD-dependent), mitochondrial [Leishmania donovani]CAC9501705.1 glycerol-3-phosphate_dehydrogenase_(FAD-dependent)_-_mitochondrial [Leishmania infantum]AYU80177.1 glycerol-3-phosphate dehydrogenase (FAD-dependent), mitochondrial [Leishmania donovani]CAM69251.2 glycerol-3-phosphate dehydrogenase (FAD-dependent), mitochondrial [Leishmania infantum JPCM|eukprot:XP_001470059.2 glycerol-3-phosphate dehydrogenase (FAD-dependent), mitochondrial [Leishmania infantum JPCM5]
MAATAVKYVIGAGVAVFGGMVGFSYTNPAWTQRRFDTSKCPPLKYETVPTREMCVQALKAHNSVTNPLDVLIIGGGCVGAGSALDAVTRGLSVGMVDMGDYAGETSSRSTKLIHGGIRYLQKAVFQADPMQLKLVAEALRERTIMIHQAPHLCHSLPTLVPCYHPIDIGMYWCGAKMYDLMAAFYGGTLEYSSFLFPYEVMKAYPKLRKMDQDNNALLGAVRYYDGQMNDARLCYSVAMTAACYGAATVNYARVKQMEVVKDDKGDELVRAIIEESIARKTIEVYSRSIINAGGPFSGEVEKLAKGAERQLDMFPAAGTHIVIDRKYCPREREAMVVPSNDGRVVFAIPWLGGCLLGTTDHTCDVQSNPPVPQADVDFLLENIRPFIGSVPPEAVKSAWTGIRPLAIPKAQKLRGGGTQNIVREHVIAVDPKSHVLNITGGKWTTYRKMAEEAVDELQRTLMKGKADFKPCCTMNLVLVGARNLDKVASTAPLGIPEDVHKHWRSNYGDRYGEVMAVATKDSKLMARLAKDSPVVEAEVVYAAQGEHCEHVMDFIARRTRIAFVNAEQAEQVVPRVTELMGQVKGWGNSKRNAERAAAYSALASFQGR